MLSGAGRIFRFSVESVSPTACWNNLRHDFQGYYGVDGPYDSIPRLHSRWRRPSGEQAEIEDDVAGLSSENVNIHRTDLEHYHVR